MRALPLIIFVMSLGSTWVSCSNQGGTLLDADGCDGYPSKDHTQYILPYNAGEAYRIYQGNCGAVSHYGSDRYAYDFQMPIGTEIIAIRTGKVIGIWMNSDVGWGKAENRISILHEDGTVADYVHLQKNTQTMSVGDYVEQGHRIAASGSSGTDLPHLHLDLFSSRNKLMSLPLTFTNTSNHPDGLKEGNTYRAY